VDVSRRNFVYLYSSSKGNPMYVGYGSTAQRALSHSKGGHNEQLKRWLKRGDFDLRIAGHTAFAPRAFAQLHRRPRRRNRRPIVQSLLHEPRDRGRVPALVKHLPGRRIEKVSVPAIGEVRGCAFLLDWRVSPPCRGSPHHLRHRGRRRPRARLELQIHERG